MAFNLSLMAGLGRAAKGAKLIVSNGLKLTFGQQPQTLELRPANTVGLRLAIPLHSLDCVGVHRMIRRQNAVEILRHLGNSQGLCGELNRSLTGLRELMQLRISLGTLLRCRP